MRYAENIPGVIDLSDAFDGRGDAYFFDAGAHFNRAGADLLAARMLERLPEGFFAGAHIPSFQLRASATEK
ncbi:MAG: hypothetical protein EOP61_02285 [Sphingomonadales bacterium]|nr:MAG: hypothetical protein EOP61_02285 [Sphingomonadales bacterium]